MKMVQKLSLLTLAVLVAGCNETVSPELQSSSATTPDSTTPVAPEEFYFSITDASPLMLNYKLHQTGAGNSAAKCEVKNNVGLTNLIFQSNLAANDITCYFEAEELSLYHQGFSFQIGASKNTCDYVGYMPFSFYDKMSGDSSDTFYQVTCANDTTNDSHVAAAALADGVNLSSTTGAAGCEDWVSQGIEALDPGTREKFLPSSDAELCRFNYTSEKCDVGDITIDEFVVTYTPPGDDPATQPAVLKSEIKRRVVDCGGSPGNCVKGPIEFISPGKTRFTQIIQSEINKDFTKKYELSALIGPKYGSNKRYVNYRRNLASKNIDYTTAGLVYDNSAFGISEADRTAGAFARTFDPIVIDSYAVNKRVDGTTLVTSSMIAAQSFPNNQYISVPSTPDPYIGLSGRVNPFYTFYCFDTSFDIKARIRMVVREWDRIFPSSFDNELISDIFRGANSRQDNPLGVEVPGEYDSYIPYNDLEDWDDFIPMERTPGAYASGSTIWRPVPLGIDYPDGFFNPANFTNGAL